MYGGREGAQSHQIRVDQVDADFDADQVGWRIAHRSGGERVEQCAAAEAEIDQIHVAQRRG